MRVFIVAAAMAATIVLPCPAGAQAQTQDQEKLTQSELQERCYRLAVIEGVTHQKTGPSVEASQLMSDCVAGKIVAPPLPEDAWQDTYQSCTDEGRFSRRISGRELITFIEKCLNEPRSASSSGSSGPSWGQKRHECARQGRQVQNLSGNDLTAYVDKCMSQT
jgi:hypothetical protein